MAAPRLNAAQRAERLRTAMMLHEQGLTFQAIADRLYGGNRAAAHRAIRDAQRRGIVPMAVPGGDDH